MFHGVINVYKEPGYTSHDVVARLRGILKQKKIGHTGTLDPAAEGVLPVCLGQGTRLCDFFADQTKTYEAVLLLGVETDTQDTTGKVTGGDGDLAAGLDQAQVEKAVMSFLGDYDQIPPMYSALKVDGKKLYQLAREGREVERKARRVHIYKLEILSVKLPRVVMRVDCSKGTYIRTLCSDIGGLLSCGGCMEHLTRTRVGIFSLEDSLKLDQIQDLAGRGEVDSHILSVEEALKDLPALSSLPRADKAVHNGNPCFASALNRTGQSPEPGALVRMYDSAGRFGGIYQYEEERHWWKPRKMFFLGEETKPQTSKGENGGEEK